MPTDSSVLRDPLTLGVAGVSALAIGVAAWRGAHRGSENDVGDSVEHSLAIGYLRSGVTLALAEVVWMQADAWDRGHRLLRHNVYAIWGEGAPTNLGLAGTRAEAAQVLGEARRESARDLRRWSARRLPMRHAPGEIFVTAAGSRAMTLEAALADPRVAEDVLSHLESPGRWSTDPKALRKLKSGRPMLFRMASGEYVVGSYRRGDVYEDFGKYVRRMRGEDVDDEIPAPAAWRELTRAEYLEIGPGPDGAMGDASRVTERATGGEVKVRARAGRGGDRSFLDVLRQARAPVARAPDEQTFRAPPSVSPGQVRRRDCRRCGGDHGAEACGRLNTGTSTRVRELREVLEHAPAHAGRIAEGLTGWTGEGITICSTCAGRLMGRGYSLSGWDPIWDAPVACETCGDRGSASRSDPLGADPFGRGSTSGSRSASGSVAIAVTRAYADETCNHVEMTVADDRGTSRWAYSNCTGRSKPWLHRLSGQVAHEEDKGLRGRVVAAGRAAEDAVPACRAPPRRGSAVGSRSFPGAVFATMPPVIVALGRKEAASSSSSRRAGTFTVRGPGGEELVLPVEVTEAVDGERGRGARMKTITRRRFTLHPPAGFRFAGGRAGEATSGGRTGGTEKDTVEWAKSMIPLLVPVG